MLEKPTKLQKKLKIVIFKKYITSYIYVLLIYKKLYTKLYTKLYAGYIPSTSIQKIRNIWSCLLELKLVKNLIFQYKGAGLFAIQIVTISVANIWRHANLSWA